MKCLLTGSSGYIGAQLLPVLFRDGHEVVGFDRREHPEAPAEFACADLLDEDALDAALDGVECVLHLAAAKDDWGLSEDEYFRDNYEATQRLIDAGRRRGIRTWVFYSTVGVLGSSRDALDETAPFAPRHPYGVSKAQAEDLFRRLAAEEPDARVLIIRPSAVYGPGNPPNTNIYRLIDAIRRNRFLTIGDGRALKTTSYLDNLLAATRFLMPRMRRGLQTYIYVDEPVLTTDELVDQIYVLLGASRPAWRLPLWAAWPIAHVSDAAAALLKTDLPITAARIRKFCTSTNFDSGAIRKAGFEQPISNEEALRATVEWYVSRHAVPAA